MIQSQGQVATPEASRYLQRLCFHFSRKISVQYDEHRAHAQFPSGICDMRADGDTLYLTCTADSADGLERVQRTLEEHIRLFTRKNPLAVRWNH